MTPDLRKIKLAARFSWERWSPLKTGVHFCFSQVFHTRYKIWQHWPPEVWLTGRTHYRHEIENSERHLEKGEILFLANRNWFHKFLRNSVFSLAASNLLIAQVELISGYLDSLLEFYEMEFPLDLTVGTFSFLNLQGFCLYSLVSNFVFYELSLCVNACLYMSVCFCVLPVCLSYMFCFILFLFRCLFVF